MSETSENIKIANKNKPVEEPQQRTSDGDGDDDDEEDTWDDARDDAVHRDCNLKSLSNYNNINENRYKLDNQASSSSAYSSVGPSDSCRSSSPPQPSLPQSSSNGLLIHEAIFKNDVSLLYEILSDKKCVRYIINDKDKHGNTPLHLACMLGRSKDIVSALLQCGASVDTKNLHRWTPFHEACSYGNREIITILTKQIKDEVYDVINKNKLSEKLEKTRNYRLVLRWEFISWIPLLSRALPHDTCVLNKQGKNIRIDTKLLDLERNYWKPSDSCLIYSNKFEKKWITVNHTVKKYQYLEPERIEKDIEDKVDDFMSTDILDFEVKSSGLQLSRSTSGWIWKSDKVEQIGKYNAAVYHFNNLFLVTRKRREHLNEKDLKANKLAFKGLKHVFQFGQKPSLRDLEDSPNGAVNSGEEEDNDEDLATALNKRANDDGPLHRQSLPPPPVQNVTWEQYCNSEPGEYPTLGREQKFKSTETAFKASVAMSDKFPLSKGEFLDLLSVVPIKLFKKLKEFIEMKLPDGFPIRVDVPVFHFLMARITFEDFEFIEGPIDDSLFSIPDDYAEDPNLFPILGRRNRRTNSTGSSE